MKYGYSEERSKFLLSYWRCFHIEINAMKENLTVLHGEGYNLKQDMAEWMLKKETFEQRTRGEDGWSRP